MVVRIMAFSTKEAACKSWSKYYDNIIIHRPLSSSYSVFIRMQQGGGWMTVRTIYA
jgi:hypothetical protein